MVKLVTVAMMLLAGTVAMAASPAMARCEVDQTADECAATQGGGHTDTPPVVSPTVPSAPVTPPSPSFDKVLTIGDSFAAGTGWHTTRILYDFWACLREDDRTHGPRIAKHFDAQHVHLACQGDKVSDTLSQWVDGFGSRFITGTGEDALIVVSAGGNSIKTTDDSVWAKVVLRCLSPFSTNCHEQEKNQPANLSEVRVELEDLYIQLLSERPDVTIRVMGYPELFQPDSFNCMAVSLHLAEARWLDAQAVLLNNEIANAVATARFETGGKIEFVDVVPAFKGHGACEFAFGESWIHDLTPGLLPSLSAFHPNKDGYRAMYGALHASFY